MREALVAWADDDQAKVALVAPLAVEFLGKATLWRKNPVLLVSLTQDHESSLLLLATNPDLTAKGLKTVGLQVLLGRLRKLLGGLPISEDHRKRLVDVRNGAIHVGAGDESRYVLLDCLALVKVLLEELSITEWTFYTHHQETVASLLDERKTEIARLVQRKFAKARMRLRELKAELGEVAFGSAVRELEAQRFSLDPRRYVAFGAEGTDATCPVCEAAGLLFGDVTIDVEMDYDVEPLGGGQYLPVELPYWAITLIPQAFVCSVCRLQLDGQEELREAGLRDEPHEVESDDLGPSFQMSNYIGDEYR